jgi:diacylglycerol kinase family enzyme
MARALLITNPMAARTDPEIVRTVSTVLGREGWVVDVVGTTHPGHAAELAADGVRGGVDVVAVYGGDGTTMQAVKSLGVGGSAGLIPGGTGNLLAGNLRIPGTRKGGPHDRPREAGRESISGRGTAGRTATSPQAAGAGFNAELMAGTTRESKRRWKMGAYVARAWRRWGR